MLKRKNSDFRFFITMTLILAALSVPGLSSADIYIIPCGFRAEVVAVNGTADDWATGFAGAGGHYVGNDRYDFCTWAESDISLPAGKTVTDAGLMVYNDWPGTRISGLRYMPVRPSGPDMYQLCAQHRNKNICSGFSRTINPGDARTPADSTFYSPGWENHKRTYDNNNTFVNDLQAHIDDPVKIWFAFEFSYFGADRAKFRFPSDTYNPASVLSAVAAQGEFPDGRNFGAGPAERESVNNTTGGMI